MIKIVGAVLIMTAGAFLAFALNRRNEEKYDRLVSFIALLRFIRKEIECYSLPVYEILLRCDGEILKGCGCADLAAAKIRPENAFGDLLSACEGAPHEKVQSKLERFSRELGRGYREEQLRICDYFISSLEELRATAEGESKKQKKLTFTLCLCGAAMVVLLII